MSPYIGIVILLAIASGFVALTILTSVLVGPGRYNLAKYDSYECGIEPTPQPVGGGRFPVKYYITAMLFIVFDIEIVADARGRGLGRSAMLAAERFALDLGRKTIGLNVFGPNERARRLYDSLGYQVVSTSMTKHLDQSG